jgi:hypothetical protein
MTKGDAMRRMLVCLATFMVVCVPTPVHAAAPGACAIVAPFTDSATFRYFPETRHALGNGFKAYWDAHNVGTIFGYPIAGVPIFGSPITEEFTEKSASDGMMHTVQYFERARFEYHPEHPEPYKVELALLGDEATAGMRGRREFQPTEQLVSGFEKNPLYYFPETRHNIQLVPFAIQWRNGGGLATFGYPISEQMSQPDGATVQYFERARFELHTDTGGKVFLGLLGDAVSPCRGS